MRPRTARGLTAALALAGVAGALAQGAGGCQQSPVTVPVRSLERSGKVSFVCLAPPQAGQVELDIGQCSAQQFTSTCQFNYQDDAGNVDAGALLPHLYALVTQTTRGEVAVIDTSVVGGVLDENPREPGAQFLHVGAEPTGIVSTPGAVATFVGVGEIGREGLFALPSSQIRPLSDTGVDPTCLGTGGGGGQGGGGTALANAPVTALSSWPACALPAAPGDMILLYDPQAPGGLERPTCDGAYQPVSDSDRISAQEGHGRAKLVMTIPSLGGIAVVDAQWLFDRPPGSFEDCVVERWLPLNVDITGLAGQQAPPSAPWCTSPRPGTPPLASSYPAQPGGLSFADGTLYVADLSAPVIHVIDLPTPCDPIERPPLLPTSLEDPTRVVFATKVSAALAPTPDLKRYLYATDRDDASAMVFDISPSSTTRRPLQRRHPEWNPFEPRDRVKFSAPPADLVLVQRDVPQTDPVTGVAKAGVQCNPDPNALNCIAGATSTSCDVGTTYQTDTILYASGAGPAKLRGQFAFAALTSGKLAVIDVDDFDAPCRGPGSFSDLAGCPPPGTKFPANASGLKTSLELSCNVVEANSARAANYEAANATAGNHVPGIQSFPLLYKLDGTLVDSAAPDPVTGALSPKMVATLPATLPPCTLDSPLQLFVGGQLTPYNFCNTSAPAMGVTQLPGAIGTSHALAMNLEDPRAQVADQNWAVSFEGPIPGFDQRLADLQLAATGPITFTDPNSRFCDSGVLGENAVIAMLVAQANPTNPQQQAKALAAAQKEAPPLADFVQITNEMLDPLDPYWSSTPAPACDYATCLTDFGTIEAPTLGRDLRILEAWQDHVNIEPRSGQNLAELKCCFPSALSFTVRVGTQWIVVGDQTGFLHHVVADASTGVCRNSCDPTLSRKNGRVVETPDATTVPGDRPANAIDPWASFMNPMFRFAIVSGSAPSVRDDVFRFSTSNSFVPLLVALSTDATVLVEPQSIIYVPTTDELAITDGSINGLIFVSLSSPTVSRSFF